MVNTPLPVQGTLGVNNFPANQPVSGTVNVGNFPSVQPVSFSNTATSPLHIRDVDNPAHLPFAKISGCTVAAGNNGCDVNFSVPSSMELVIETVSVNALLNSGEQGNIHILVKTNGVPLGPFNVPLTLELHTSSGDVYGTTQPLRLYADPGTTVGIIGLVNDFTGGASFDALAVSGYLVSCGSGTGCPLQ